MRLKPINDKFKTGRGGSSYYLDLSCPVCRTYLGTYQKDGPGSLVRLYVDRLISPHPEYNREFSRINEMPKLICVNQKCRREIAVPMVYIKENRLAYRIVSSIHKSRNRSGKLPTGEAKTV